MLRLAREAYAGAFLFVAGAGILLLTWRYPSGTPSDIGPGFVLQASGALVALLGLLLVQRGWRKTADAPEADAAGFKLRPFIVPAAMAGFGLLLPWLGLAFTGFLATLAVSFGARELSWRERLLAAAILAAFVTLLFGYGLKLQVKIWP
ncbi:tripartite tricarboxylate transporter TctB family protein [Ferrovibrio sp.]|uniref:tripartite tricarboxylate transporter TctB family protein n=1 Tax=Ferrovibrio sp. TaxID=1917215 RepID=UPI001B3F327C|nr:tripartite tricarboxylate transporter TctB family protein [Ferrovibrio sp.]MBP7064144.1 tripartite tricarboxylate transporter TctB family protein [Ferrovibrio sp.]